MILSAFVVRTVRKTLLSPKLLDRKAHMPAPSRGEATLPSNLPWPRPPGPGCPSPLSSSEKKEGEVT